VKGLDHFHQHAASQLHAQTREANKTTEYFLEDFGTYQLS
jgi:hypothetical protein